MKYVVEVGGNSWLNGDTDGDPGRTCVLENARLYDRTAAMSAMLRAMVEYPSRSYDIKKVMVVPCTQYDESAMSFAGIVQWSMNGRCKATES